MTGANKACLESATTASVAVLSESEESLIWLSVFNSSFVTLAPVDASVRIMEALSSSRDFALRSFTLVEVVAVSLRRSVASLRNTST
ncbi:hypothetical protein D3C80_1641420 [compost metagenome]